MILEYCQLLVVAHRALESSIADHPLMYKTTHVNSPCAVWVRASTGNYRWLYRLTVALCAEYTHRYGKVHKAQRDGLVTLLERYPEALPKKGQTPLYLAMPDEYKHPVSDVKSYRNLYAGGKAHLLTWTDRPMPYFLEAYGYKEKVEFKFQKL